MKVILYISHFHTIGGVERFVLNFAKRFPNATILYDQGEPGIGQKIKWNEHYICDIFINVSAIGKMAFDKVEAKSYVHMIHGDYKVLLNNYKFQYNKHKKTTHHIAVSESAKKSFEEVTPYKCDAVFYNFVDDTLKPETKPKNDVLKLVTVSRISKEKGFERMIEFAKQIPVPYTWEVFGELKSAYSREMAKNFNFKGITRHPHKEILKADYLVQLSDTEGYSCVINEALQMRTPCIVTPFPSGFEQIEHGKNGYRIPFDVKNIDFDSIINKIPVVEPYKDKTTVDDWLNFFKFVVDEFYKNNKMVTIKVLKDVTNYKAGQIIEVSEERATAAIDKGLAEVYFPAVETKELKTVRKTKSVKK